MMRGRSILGSFGVLMLVLAGCSTQGARTIGSAAQAVGAEGDPCTLAGASTAGLQGDCNSGLWCNLQTNMCQSAYLQPGVPIPLPPDGSTSGCSDIAAGSACSSGSCNLAHTACGCQIDQDCGNGQSCSQQSFECVAAPGADLAMPSDLAVAAGDMATAPDMASAATGGTSGGTRRPVTRGPNGRVAGLLLAMLAIWGLIERRRHRRA